MRTQDLKHICNNLENLGHLGNTWREGREDLSLRNNPTPPLLPPPPLPAPPVDLYPAPPK